MSSLRVAPIVFALCFLGWIQIIPAEDQAQKPITIATIVPADNRRLFSINRIQTAMSIALEKVTNELQLVTTRNLTIKYADSNCSVADGINQAINFFVKKEVDVFFGPCCDYAAAPVGRQIRYWNIPMITPGAMARDFAILKRSMFSLMTRMGPNLNHFVQFLLVMLKYYNWGKVKIIYDPEGHKNIVEKYCHIAADGIHYGLKIQNVIPDLQQEYFKFDTIDDILNNMAEQISNEYASKCFFLVRCLV